MSDEILLRKSGRLATFIVVLALLTGSPLKGADTLQLTKVVPLEIQTPLPNPYMGSGDLGGPAPMGGINKRPFSGAYNTTGFADDAPLFNWVLVDWDWAALNPRKDNVIGRILTPSSPIGSARHKQFVVRILGDGRAGTGSGVPRGAL